ncbi:MAG: helix-turn-helix domain-containing protein [Ruminococcus flavefaciens]|nr:helix-turn-helix domain-containing protein [Ruminococcus flavefaciens]MCM1059250.1 helix-turn-helix domain-containing protein [Eubacterium sp.]
MPVYKRKIEKDFTVVHNAFVRDKALGINARGILITMLSMPEYGSNGEPWNFTIRGLADILPDGKAKIQSALNELEKHGYLMRKKIVCKGRFVDVEYTFSDEPMPEAIAAYEEKQKNKKEKSVNSGASVLYPDFQDTEKLDTKKLDTKKQDDNKILSDKILSDKILSNQSVSQSVSEKAPTKKAETDGQTDGKKKSMPFSEVLEEIGFDTYGMDFEPTSEKEMQEFDEEDRKASGCTIPYSLKADKKAMKEALKFLFAYSYYAPTMPDKDKRLLDTVISVITEMTEKDIQEYQEQRVRYSDVIDRLNDVIHGPDGSLYDWYISFEQQWNKILAENDIKHQKAYMKSCIWNWLNDYAFEDDNSLRELEYKFRQGVI